MSDETPKSVPLKPASVMVEIGENSAQGDEQIEPAPLPVATRTVAPAKPCRSQNSERVRGSAAERRQAEYLEARRQSRLQQSFNVRDKEDDGSDWIDWVLTTGLLIGMSVAAIIICLLIFYLSHRNFAYVFDSHYC